MKEIISDLYLQFRKPLLYFIKNKIRDKNIAEDLLQEVFIKASNNIHSLKDEQKVQSWLYKISTNVIIDHIRKYTIPNISFEEMNFKVEMESYILNELSCCLHTFINSLPNSQKNILAAVYFNEISLVEYSLINNINISTVKSHSRRAKNKLKKIFYECCTFKINKNDEIVYYEYKSSYSCICNKTQYIE